VYNNNTYLFTIKTLIEYYANTPNINFVIDLRRLAAGAPYETFGRQIPDKIIW